MYKKAKILAIGFTLAFFFSSLLFSQYIPTHISKTGIYDFLDEMAAMQIIEINSAIKPYSRTMILDKLNEVNNRSEELSKQQKDELRFYLKDYGKALNNLAGIEKKITNWIWINKPSANRIDFFYYQDSVFQITVNPILGGNFWNNDSGSFHHWWNGIETYASYKNFALFASLRDNHESAKLTDKSFLTKNIGGATIKELSNGQRDYWEMRGGISYAWNWGHAAIIMDQFSWGDAYNGSNIFSGRTPAFARAEFQLNPTKWMQFNYLHGWLISEVVDSSLSFWSVNSYGIEYREVYHPKYMAANYFTFKPLKHLYLALGNSVIYDLRTPHLAFLIPPMFWKPIDHTLSAGIDNMNSQMFFTLSSRNIKGIHLYASAFIDELAVGRIFTKGEYNFTSTKFGIRSYNIKATNLTFEYTWSNAMVFQHYVTTTTFKSNGYNLGHFLEDNAKDFYGAIEIRPFRTIKIKAYYNESLKGPDYTFLGRERRERTNITPLDPIIWESTKMGIIGSIEVINDLYLRLGYENRNVTGEEFWINRWTPEVYHGKTGTMLFGINYGW